MAEQERRRCRIRWERAGGVEYEEGELITIGPSSYLDEGNNRMPTTSAFVELDNGKIREVSPDMVEMEPKRARGA